MSELEKLINDWGSYLDKMRSSYLGDLAKKSLSKESVCAYIRHIPIEDIHDGWPKEVYKKTKIMIRMMVCMIGGLLQCIYSR